jgi:mannose-6-phosphate isomerase-like protein (cupin superfamily)
MNIRRLDSRREFRAGDGCLLRELLHAEKDGLALNYSLARAVVKTGERTAPHRLKSSEVYYVLRGTGIMRIGDESAEVSPDDTVYIPPGAVQSIENTGGEDLVFLCIVDPAWREEDEEIVKDAPR